MKKFAIAVCLFGIVSLALLVTRVNKSPTKSSKTVIKPNLEREQLAISKGELPIIHFTLPDGYVVHVFANNLGSPRDLQFSPDGTLLVSNPISNSVTALPDKNGDGMADENKIVISQGNRVHGLAFFDNKLYVAEVNRVAVYDWDGKNIEAKFNKQFFHLPNNSDHNNRSIVFDEKGSMFLSLGSTCNVCNESFERGGSVLKSNSQGIDPSVLAKGLRNAAFLAINPKTHALWGTEMGRDYLGDNIPPDEINIIEGGSDYGWPNCYGDKMPDRAFNKRANCTGTVTPTFQMPAHSAPLGLVFIDSIQFPGNWQNDLLVALHGSWNRSAVVGYKIVHIKLEGNHTSGMEDFMSGFNPGTQKDDSLGRPVDVAFDKKGNLFVSDDKAGMVYIVQKVF